MPYREVSPHCALWRYMQLGHCRPIMANTPQENPWNPMGQAPIANRGCWRRDGYLANRVPLLTGAKSSSSRATNKGGTCERGGLWHHTASKAQPSLRPFKQKKRPKEKPGKKHTSEGKGTLVLCWLAPKRSAGRVHKGRANSGSGGGTWSAISSDLLTRYLPCQSSDLPPSKGLFRSGWYLE